MKIHSNNFQSFWRIRAWTSIRCCRNVCPRQIKFRDLIESIFSLPIFVGNKKKKSSIVLININSIRRKNNSIKSKGEDENNISSDFDEKQNLISQRAKENFGESLFSLSRVLIWTAKFRTLLRNFNLFNFLLSRAGPTSFFIKRKSLSDKLWKTARGTTSEILEKHSVADYLLSVSIAVEDKSKHRCWQHPKHGELNN